MLKVIINVSKLKSLQYLGVAVSCTICFLTAYGISSIKHKLDVTKVDKVTGYVVLASVVRRYSGGARSFSQKVFMFQLNNLGRPLGTYRPEQDYTKLTQNIKIGDTITVYYNKNVIDNKLNIDVYQIEKKGQILQDYKSYAHNNLKPLVLLFIFIGFSILLFGPLVIELKKYVNK